MKKMEEKSESKNASPFQGLINIALITSMSLTQSKFKCMKQLKEEYDLYLKYKNKINPQQLIGNFKKIINGYE